MYGLRKDHKEQKTEKKRSEEIREEIGEALNPVNSLENKRNKDGGRKELANNPEVQLRMVGGISNPANNQTKDKCLGEGGDDLANNLNINYEELGDTDKNIGENIIKKKGPKLRPVVGANKASSRPISHILSRVINKVSEIIGRTIRTSCESTEEMMFEIEEVNKDIEVGDDIIIGSLDVIKWYPSMELKRLIEIVMELMIEANLNIEEIDMEKLSIYIATNLNEEDIKKENLEYVVHRRKEGKRAGMTNRNIWLTDGDKCQWEMPHRKPVQAEKQRMFAVAVCIGIKVVMENHIYKFGGELRKQKEGGPIGVELTGALADLFMLYWDRKFLAKLKDINIQVKGYKRYKDDTNIMLKPIDRNLKFVEGCLVAKNADETKKESNLEIDEISMNIVKNVADSLEDMIKTEIDFPSNSKNAVKKMSILDIQVWVEKVEKENKETKNQIFFEFYEKPMSSKFVLMKDSAAPLSQKRTVLTQEGIRRLKNCKLELKWEQKAKHLSDFMQKMKNSGYDEIFRLEVLKSSINGHEKIVEEHINGSKPIYRNKEWKERNNWNSKKKFKKENWWKGGGQTENKSVIFVPATPGSELINWL